jgi:uncharacterized protein (DUF2252 family)
VGGAGISSRAAEAIETSRLPDPLRMQATVAERAALGKAVRRSTPLDAHAVFDPCSRRVGALELLRRQDETRVPELLPVRYGRMVASPFAFYRGAAMVMAEDLASMPSSGLTVQLCGDAHLSNFGFYASPERRLLFDLNDFDETLPGPFEWDVKRLAASFEIAARGLSFKAKQRRAIVLAVARSYRESMRGFAKMSNLDVWYARLDVDQLLHDLRGQLPATQELRLERVLAKARRRDSRSAFSKLVRVEDGHASIAADPPLIVPLRDLLPEQAEVVSEQQMDALLLAYRETLASDRRWLLDQYRFVDIARKVVGVGSVGTRAWVVLLEGRDAVDPLFLQAKEAQASVLEPHLGASEFPYHGQRVVAGQRLLQAASDIFLGWQRSSGLDGVDRDYYVRQLRDWKGSVEVEGATPAGMTLYARTCGWTLARAHARSGDRVAVAAYLGKRDSFDRAIADLAGAYADQNDRDHAALRAAIDGGQVEAHEGV